VGKGDGKLDVSDRGWSFPTDNTVNKIAIVHRVFVLSGSIWWGHIPSAISLASPTLIQQPLSRNTAFSHVLSSLIFSRMDRSSYPPHTTQLSSTF